ncbi:hypothetical protein HAPAU_37350 [Halalkalicoccus paucihalophilus]|uniref:Uncharacterized protein n=1 Tax=Halalkalicoccus paucihalophilus TaxID=1008153 RepID=A0A151A9J1_9EURY|nr:hypothetical protein HAPAU_37350 [Halalkalicoccus paucihalophilus]
MATTMLLEFAERTKMHPTVVSVLIKPIRFPLFEYLNDFSFRYRDIVFLGVNEQPTDFLEFLPASLVS